MNKAGTVGTQEKDHADNGRGALWKRQLSEWTTFVILKNKRDLRKGSKDV